MPKTQRPIQIIAVNWSVAIVPMASPLERQPGHSLSAPIVRPLSGSTPGCRCEPEDAPNAVLTLLSDPDWRPNPDSWNISHWTCGRMPAPLDCSYDTNLGKPTWVSRSSGHASGLKIFIGDLPPDLTVAEFRTRWLVNSSTVRQALTVLDTDSMTKGPAV